MTDRKRFLVAWDFSKKRSGTFYRVLTDEFGESHPAGEYELIQRSVALCCDDFIANRLAALAESFGAQVVSFSIVHESPNNASQREARAYVGRVLKQRLHLRGRHRSVRTRAGK